ncbi:MAG: class I SAM-dependent methyltransferase [Opitutales bacterium]
MSSLTNLFARHRPITGETVRDDFNAIEAVVHYTRAAHFLGLWKSEQTLIRRHFPDESARLLEAGCGAGRVTIGLCHEGYRHLTAFDFAGEMVEQAQNLADERGLTGPAFLQADATNLVGTLTRHRPAWAAQSGGHEPYPEGFYDGALFLFNGMMQIPGRENRRAAMRELRRVCRPGATFIFTTHDRDSDPVERAAWVRETILWERGEQNPRLREFGDRYFAHEHGQTFMHLPDRAEVLADLAATGWAHVEDTLRNEIAKESQAVQDFSDNCRFWVSVRE